MNDKLMLEHVRVVQGPAAGALERKAVQVFCEEVASRTGLTLRVDHSLEGEGLAGRERLPLTSIIFVQETALSVDYPGQLPAHDSLSAAGKEGYRIVMDRRSEESNIWVIGADERGVFYGMGKLLRVLTLIPSALLLPADFQGLSSTPLHPLRGHQLAYRDKHNTCDAWTERQFEQYIRELAIFGANAIEILPQRTDDALYGRLMKKSPQETLVAWSNIIHSYGMDVWLWYPNMGGDYTDPVVYEREMAERERVFASLPHLDALFIPAGDPGELEPVQLFQVMEDVARILHRHHPQATVWVAPQVFAPSHEWYDDFYREVRKEPVWLYGLCFAPWQMDTIEEMVHQLPEKYKGRIRHYPDISHNLNSQFPVPEWDSALAVFEGRECYNPRPVAMKHIHNMHSPYTIGSITYSEGVHDDVNKFVWADQDWNPATDARETLVEYCRLFMDPRYEQELAEALLSLEEGWKGKLLHNQAVDRNYAEWIQLEQKVSSACRGDFRFQMGLLRSCSDYYAKSKHRFDKDLEHQARHWMERAPEVGVRAALREARHVLDIGLDEPFAPDLRTKQLQLADQLFASIGLQLSTKRHAGQFWVRGAYLDMIDQPLSDALWLLDHINRLLQITDEAACLQELHDLLHRTDPGEGGYYDQFGTPESMKRLAIANDWGSDPGFLNTVFVETDTDSTRSNEEKSLCTDRYHLWTVSHRTYALPEAWLSRARAIYRTPLIITYDGLDPQASYTIKLTYIDAFRELKYKLTAGEDIIIHETIGPRPREHFDPTFEFVLPPEAYKEGALTLSLTSTGKLGGVNVSEIWIKKQ